MTRISQAVMKIPRNYNSAWNLPLSFEGKWDNSSSWVLNAWSCLVLYGYTNLSSTKIASTRY